MIDLRIAALVASLAGFAATESIVSALKRRSARKTQEIAEDKFVSWHRLARQRYALVCMEAPDCDLVWCTDDRERGPELPGTVRQWALSEGIPIEPCPGYPTYFLLVPVTDDQAFELRMRWH